MNRKKIYAFLLFAIIFLSLVACEAKDSKERDYSIDVNTGYSMRFSLPAFTRAGETQHLVPSGALDAGAAVQYRSSDDSIAAVAMDGTITAVSPGEAVITIVVEANGQSVEHTVEVVCDWEQAAEEPSELWAAPTNDQ